MAKGHFTAADYDKLHDANRALNSTEGGSCMTGHQGDFSGFGGKATCNYRYQAYEQAKSESAIKNRLHDYASITVDLATSVYETKKGGWSPSRYSMTIKPPRPGDWDVGGPTLPITRKSIAGETVVIPPSMNFTQDTWPYWNNAHHIIPKGQLNHTIGLETLAVGQLMKKALMTAKYNVNHKINMFMLPQDREVAKVLGLARHIQLKEDDADGISGMCTNHPIYNRLVDDKLTQIINGYRTTVKSAIDSAEKTHDVPNPSLDKAKLEALSKELMDLIVSWGKKRDGSSLDKNADEALNETV